MSLVTEKATRFSLAESISYTEGKVVNRAVVKKPCGNIILFAFDKDQELTEHTAPFDAVVQVLEGSARISIDKEPHLLDAGDAIILPANIPHAVYANTQMKMMLTLIKE